MAIDLEAIRKRMAQLNGDYKNSSVQFWKPGPGTYKVRLVPWKNLKEGEVFAERWFYYIGAEKGILAPKQFGKPDPIEDFIRKLYSTKKSEDRELAKQLYSKMRAYSPLIVRGQEEKGVQLYSFGKQVLNRLLGFFVDEEPLDVVDPLDGHDLKITLTKVVGKQYCDTTIDVVHKASKLHDDAKQMQAWLDGIPNLDDIFKQKSSTEIESVLAAWLNSGAPTDEGTARGATVANAVDELKKVPQNSDAEPKAESTPAPVKTEEKKKRPAKPDVDNIDPVKPAKKSSLDEAFEDLMKPE